MALNETPPRAPLATGANPELSPAASWRGEVMVRLKDAHTHPQSVVDAFPADTSAQALVPLDAQALQTPNAEKCLTEQHTYSKHCLIHVLKSHLQAYFPSSGINHCKYALINKATQTDCLFHPCHAQVTGQHPGERRFPAHLSPPWRTPAQVAEEKQWESCYLWHNPIHGYLSQRKAAESITVLGMNSLLLHRRCTRVPVLKVTAVPSSPHLTPCPTQNTHLCHYRDEISQAGTGDEALDGQDVFQRVGFLHAAAHLHR